MPALITAADLRERFDIDNTILDPRLTPHIGSASRRLRGWVGEAAYVNALGTAAEHDDLRADLKNAEAHLAYHYAIFGLHFNVRTKGVLATSVSTEGKEVRRYLSPAETAQLSKMFLEMAREIAEPYLQSDGTPGSSFELAYDEDEDA